MAPISVETPLMHPTTPVKTCWLHKNLFGSVLCQVSHKQDIHTRTRQEMIFNHLKKQHASVVIWDPTKVLFNKKKHFTPFNKHNQYMMIDAHHLIRIGAKSLQVPIQDFLKKQHWL